MYNKIVERNNDLYCRQQTKFFFCVNSSKEPSAVPNSSPTICVNIQELNGKKSSPNLLKNVVDFLGGKQVFAWENDP